MFSRWFAYYIAVGLFTSGMMFGIIAVEKHKFNWQDWISILLGGVLWPIVMLYVILQEKYNR